MKTEHAKLTTAIKVAAECIVHNYCKLSKDQIIYFTNKKYTELTEATIVDITFNGIHDLAIDSLWIITVRDDTRPKKPKFITFCGLAKYRLAEC